MTGLAKTNCSKPEITTIIMTQLIYFDYETL